MPGLVSVSADGSTSTSPPTRLVTQDHNGQEIKIYDARTSGGFPAERPRSSARRRTSATAPAAARPGAAAGPHQRDARLEGNAKQARKTKKHKKKAQEEDKKHKKGKRGNAKGGRPWLRRA